MPCKIVTLLLATTLIAATAHPDQTTTLQVNSQPAVVLIKPVPEGRRLVRLPALEFVLIIAAQCAADAEAASVSISIADTRETLEGDKLANPAELLAEIRISSRQLSPLAIDGFCQAQGGMVANSADLLVRDAVTAQVSLRCQNDGRESIVYASHPLDITLRCASEPLETGAASD